jgi:hypothetical protein
MPYIPQQDRARAQKLPATAGELNYAITALLTWYVGSKGQSYQTYNDMLGALEGAKLELYRREIAPYENFKIEQNGDVY